jgi:hypothetical protein
MPCLKFLRSCKRPFEKSVPPIKLHGLTNLPSSVISNEGFKGLKKSTGMPTTLRVFRSSHNIITFLFYKEKTNKCTYNCLLTTTKCFGRLLRPSSGLYNIKEYNKKLCVTNQSQSNLPRENSRDEFNSGFYDIKQHLIILS